MFEDDAVLAAWDFNGPEGTTEPRFGTGWFSLTGGTSLLLAGGEGSSDPALRYPPNHCIGIYNFPPQSCGAETAGVAFLVPSMDHHCLRIAFDAYPDALSNRWLRLQLTWDEGRSWWNHEVDGEYTRDGLFQLNAPRWHRLSADLAKEPRVNDNRHFGFRLVTAFAPNEAIYESCGNKSPYSRFGLLFFDMVTVLGKRIR